MPYCISLAILPFNKAVGFLVVDDPDDNFCDWREFLKRMAIITTMWIGPMYLTGSTTAEIVRCVHGDVSRYERDNDKREKRDLYAVRRQDGEEIDEEGIEIRERAMACTVKYMFVFPLVIYITFYAIGALVEAAEYAVYSEMEGDSFEIQTGKQVCMIRLCNYDVSLNVSLKCKSLSPFLTSSMSTLFVKPIAVSFKVSWRYFP